MTFKDIVVTGELRLHVWVGFEGGFLSLKDEEPRVCCAKVSSIAEGFVCAAALKGMSRNPEATSKLRSSMILGVSLCETVAIYGLVLAILLIFVKNPGSF